MPHRPLDRRTVLRGAGGIALGLPMMDAMGFAKSAHAATVDPKYAINGFPKRILFFFSANGTVADAWLPTADFKMGRILEPLEPHKKDILLFKGVHGLSGSSGPQINQHDMGMGHMLTATDLVKGPGGFSYAAHFVDGSAGGPSIDQEIAKSIGGTTKFRSLELGVVALPVAVLHMASCMSYQAAFQRMPPQNDPGAVFTRVFTDLTGAGTNPETLATLTQLRERRKSVLDLALGDFKDLKGRVGVDDRRKLDAHVEALSGFEKRLNTPESSAPSTGSSCKRPAVPAAGLNWKSSANFDKIGPLQMDLLIAALACDVTRVGSLQWSFAESYQSFPWLGIGAGHHDISHLGDSDTAGRENLIKINNWYAQQFASLIERLKSVPEGDGTLFDHTALVWVNELGKGNNHSLSNYPFVIASGSRGRMFKSGRLVTAAGVPHNNLFVSLLHAMGNMQATQFGNPKFSTGNLDSEILV